MEIMLLVLIQLIYILLSQLGLIVDSWVVVFLPTIGTLVYIGLMCLIIWSHEHHQNKRSE